MQTIKDWVEYYREKRFWVYPYNLEERKWLYWKNLKSKEDYDKVCKEWDWNSSTGIKLVVGKKGIRVVEITNKKLLKRTLILLGLPEDYPWVIYSQSKYGIIVDTPGIATRTKGLTNRSYRHALLLWEGYYILPSTNIPVYFYKNRMPTVHPQQIEDNKLLDCIETLILHKI